MTDNWNSFELTGFFPSEARALTEGVSTIVDSLNTFLGIVRTTLEIVSSLAATATSSPIEAIIKEALDELTGFIDDLLDSTTAHAIFIPIQKQFFGLGARIPDGAVIQAEIPGDFDSLVLDGAFPLQVPGTIAPETVLFVNTSHTAIGGNQGFWKTFVLSQQDVGDPNRPDFPEDFAVTGACIVFGSEQLSRLQNVFDIFNAVLNLGFRGDLSARTRPVAENLRVKTVPLPGGEIGVQLDWDPIPPTQTLALYSDQQLIAKEILVIRSTDPSLREKFSWKEEFAGQPSDSSSDLPESNESKVIARINNDGLIKRYTDTEGLEEGQTYYYALAIRYTLGGETQPVSNFSAVRRIRYIKRPQSSRQAEPPDWWATPGLLELFPVLRDLVAQVKLSIAALTSRTLSPGGIQGTIEQTISQINSLIAEGQATVDTLTGINNKLNAIINSDLIAGVHSTSFSVSTGGMTAWNAELAKRLSDTTDTSRPPYENNELVGGVVIVAGAPSLSQLDAFIKLLELFFGSSDDNPIAAAIDSIDAELDTALTAPTFDEGLVGDRKELPLEEDSSPTRAFDESLSPTEEC